MGRLTKLWVALLVGGAALLAAWALPPEGSPFMSTGRRTLSPEEGRHRALEAEIELANEMLRRGWRAREVAARLAGQEARLVIDVDDGRGGAFFRERALREVEGISPRVRLGLFMLDQRAGGHPEVGAPEVRTWTSYHVLESYAGEDAEGPFCAIVVPGGMPYVPPSEVSRLWPTVLGPCLLHARHGAPGVGTAAWLEAGGYRFASEPVRPERGSSARRGAFGMDRSWLGGDDVVPATFLGESCLAGRTEACHAAVTSWDDATSPPAVLMGSTPLSHVRFGAYAGVDPYDPFGRFTGNLLFDLEAELGPERFARLWRGDAPFERTFEEVVGQPLSRWVHDWAVARLGTAGVGPALGWSTAGLGLLALLGLAAAAVMTHGRRQVG